MNYKFCGKCEKIKPITAFSRNKCRKDGLQDYCKQCMYALNKQWLKTYPTQIISEHRIEYLRHYRRRGKSKGRELRRKAKERGTGFNMTIQEFADWFNGQKKICHYCGREVFEFSDLPPNKRRLSGLTIDRMDNNEPYAVDNIAIACGRCNLMKGSWLTEKQTSEIAKRYFKQGKQGGLK